MRGPMRGRTLQPMRERRTQPMREQMTADRKEFFFCSLILKFNLNSKFLVFI